MPRKATAKVIQFPVAKAKGHAADFVVKSAPVKTRKPRKATAFDADRHFWPNVDTSAGPEACHLWTGQVDQGNGYGRMFHVQGLPYAHRRSWELANGRKVPAGKMVLHARGCSSKLCCNPDHLRIGTVQENSADAVAEGRIVGRKLNFGIAEEIRALRFFNGMTYIQLADQYKVRPQTIADICKYRSYKEPKPIRSRPVQLNLDIAPAVA